MNNPKIIYQTSRLIHGEELTHEQYAHERLLKKVLQEEVQKFVRSTNPKFSADPEKVYKVRIELFDYLTHLPQLNSIEAMELHEEVGNYKTILAQQRRTIAELRNRVKHLEKRSRTIDGDTTDE